MNKSDIEKLVDAIHKLNLYDLGLPSLKRNTIKKLEEKHINFDDIYNKILEYAYSKEMDELIDVICELEDVSEEEEFYISSRIKTKESIERKWQKNLELPTDKQRPICKVLNDVMGIRIIVNVYYDVKDIVDNIKLIADKKDYKIDLVPLDKDDGYKGVHIYFRNDAKSFRIEIQIWSRIDSIINSYTHDHIYKVDGDKTYSFELRKWIEKLDDDFILFLWNILEEDIINEENLNYIEENLKDLDYKYKILEYYKRDNCLDEDNDIILRLGQYIDELPALEGNRCSFEEYIYKMMVNN